MGQRVDSENHQERQTFIQTIQKAKREHPN